MFDTSKKVMIVEDEEYIADMYRFKFREVGFEPIMVSDGQAVLNEVAKAKPDLILLDIIIPKLNGYQVLEKLKGDPETKDIKIYILSNLGQNNEIAQGFAEGADGYLIKSNLTPTQLVEAVDKIFNGEQVGLKKENYMADLKPKDEIPEELVTKKKRILLIEDEESLASIYKVCFEKNNFEVEVAKNGAWGLKLAAGKSFDLIIMDMVMPTMNGYEAIEKLKEDKKTQDIPIVILSNSAQDDDMEKARQLGVTDLLLKSQVTPSKLVEEADKVLVMFDKY